MFCVFLYSSNNIKNYFFPSFTNRTIKTCHSYILLHFVLLYFNNFDYIYFTFAVIFFTVSIAHWIAKNLRKLPRTISEESANVSMNEILINLLQQNRAEKVEVGGRGKRYHQVQLLMRKYLSKSSSQVHCCNTSSDDESSDGVANDESSNGKEDDGITCEICEINLIELTEALYSFLKY